MEKILVVDYMSPRGHENFDAIHIQSLSSLGFELTVIGRKGQFDEVGNLNNVTYYELPSWCFASFRFFKAFFIRIRQILALFYIMIKFRTQKYDYIIFLCYDILSISFFYSRTKVVLINHNNVGQLDNGIKLFLTRRYSEYMHVCLNIQMTNRLKEMLPDHNIHHVPHGLITPSIKVKKPSFINNNEEYVFCPIRNNYDVHELSKLFCSKILKDFLEGIHVHLYIRKGLVNVIDNDMVLEIPNDLSKEEYDYLIQNTIAVLIPYSRAFNNRCSGVFFEAISSDKPIITSNNPALLCYDNVIKQYIINNVEDLVKTISDIRLHRKIIYDKSYFSPTNYWKEALV